MRRNDNNCMTTSTRRKLGCLLSLLAIGSFLALVIADVPLLTMNSQHFDATGGNFYTTIYVRWPLVLTAIVFAAGVALVIFPRRRAERQRGADPVAQA